MRTRSLERSAPWSQPSGRRSLRGGPYPARGTGLTPRRQASILILAWRDRFLDRCNLSSTILGSNVRQSRVIPPTLHRCSPQVKSTFPTCRSLPGRRLPGRERPGSVREVPSIRPWRGSDCDRPGVTSTRLLSRWGCFVSPQVGRRRGRSLLGGRRAVSCRHKQSCRTI